MSKKQTEPTPKNTLLIIFIIFTLVILGLEYFLYYFESNRIVDEEIKNLSSVAMTEENNVINWYNDFKEKAVLYKSSTLFRKTFISLVQDPDNASNQQYAAEFLRLEVNEKHFVGAFVCDSTGEKIYNLGTLKYSLRPKTKNDLYKIDSETPSHISEMDLLYDEKTEYFVPYLEFVIGIFPSDETYSRPIGYVVFLINPREDLFKLLNTWVKQKSTSESMIIGIDGDEIVYLNDLRYVQNSVLRLKAKIGVEQIPGKRISTAQKGVYEGLDYRGEKVLAYTTFIPQMNWYLVVKVDKIEILANANKILYLLSGSIVLILFLIIIILGVLWKREGIETLKKDLEVQRTQAMLSQKYQIVSKYANDAFLLINKNGQIAEANDKAVEMYGYTHQELKNMPVMLLRSPEVRDELPAVMESIKRSGGLVYETVHQHKNGTRFHVEISAKIIAIDGEIFFVGIYRNIEDRKRVENELKESEKKFHSLFEQAHDAILILRKDEIIDCNNKALELFNLKKDTVINKKIIDLSVPTQPDGVNSRESFPEKLQKTMRGQSVLFDWQFNRKHSGHFDSEVSLNTVTIKGETFIQTIIRDVTEKRKSLEMMKKLTNAFQNTAEMMLITDTKGVIEYANPAFEKVTGYSAEEVIGKTPAILKSDQQSPEFYKDLWETILAGNSWHGILVNKKKNKQLYTEEMIISPIRNEKNAIISFVAVKKDVSERIKGEEEVKRARFKAEESDRIKSNFLSMMSHEVRTPLNVILGFLDIIKNAVNKEAFPEKDHFFDMINRNSKRLMTLINDIIDVSRIESNEMKLTLSNQSLHKLLANITSEFELSAQAKGLKLVDDINKIEDVFVRVDDTRFQQVLSNLLTNAIKFTLKGTITVSAKTAGSNVHIFVKDTGIGIPPEFRPHLFEFFRQADEGYNRNYEGAGLGLAISYKLVKLMNGDMKVDSEVGKGSTFTITFPIVDESTAIEEEVKELELAEKEKIASAEPTVLIVEDNQDNSYFVEVILHKLGIRYYSVPGANEAFDYLKQYKFDLILMDISLITGMNGEEAFKVIRSNKAYEHIPIIAMTAHAMLGDRDHFISVGFDDYISKPFTVEQLTEMLFKFLREGLEQTA